jgi:O-antigen ligase
VTRYLLLILFVGTMGSRALGLDLGLAPGVSIKNAMLYLVATAIAIESSISRNRKLDLLPVVLPMALLILYASMSWLMIVVFLESPNYAALGTLVRLKVKLFDQFLMLLVFCYGLVNWQDALWLFKALTWTVIVGCLITVIDSFNIPDLGIITTRDQDGRVEGIIGSAQEFGGLLAFVLPSILAVWWKESGLKKFAALVGVGLVLVSIMLSASRGAMLGVVAGAIIAAFYLRQYLSPKVITRATVMVAIAIAISTIVVLSTDFGALLESRLSTGLETGDVQAISSGRTAIWYAAWQQLAQYPTALITGMGWETYFQSVGHRYATHSVYLDRLYNLGIIGLALFVVSFFNAIVIMRRGLRNCSEQAAPVLIASVIGVIAFMIAMAFSDIHGAAIYIWAFTGVALRIAVAGSVPEDPKRTV